MQHVPKALLLPLFAATISGTAWAREDGQDADTGTALHPKAAEYKRSDADDYLKSDILKVNPAAVIIPKGGYTQTADSYFFTPKIKAPKTLQFEVFHDWIEPITPPDAPPGLAIPPDAMQIREPQGDVRVALPSAPANFIPVADGMPLVNGAVIRTGPNATAAVLFGGVCSARLMPNSAAAVQQTVTATARTVELDLTQGGVFSKVGQQVGVEGQYEVHTPFGNAVARGTDFVTITTATRTDVWIAQGTVSLEPPDGKAAQMATSDGTGALKMLRYPPIADPHQVLTADAETLTMIFDFIPTANQKIASLRSKVARGDTLTPGQQDYLHRIKEIPSLIKLALVEKTPPPPAIVKREPAAEGGSTLVPPPPPMTITLGPGDLVHFDGQDTTVTKLKARLAEIAKTHPDQPLEIARDIRVGPILLKRVADACHHAKLTTKVLDPTPAPIATAPTVPAPIPTAPAAEGGSTTVPPPMTITLGPGDLVHFDGHATTVTKLKAQLAEIAKSNPAQPLEIARDTSVGPILLKRVADACHHAKLATKVLDPTPAPAVTTPTPAVPPAAGEEGGTAQTIMPKALPISPTPKAKPLTEPAKPPGPLTVTIHVNGSIKFEGKTITLAEFQTRLKALIKKYPEQELVIESGTTVPYDNLKAVLDSCVNAEVRHVTVTSPSPATPPLPPSIPATSETPARNLPAPTLLMHPAMQTMSSNAPPIAPSSMPDSSSTQTPHPSGP